MKDILKIGILIADDDEYAPVLKKAEEYETEEFGFYSRRGHKITLDIGKTTAELWFPLCGTGKINAALAALFLIEKGVDIMLNVGLSGGISGISRGEIMVGTEYSEHDFDLTPLGYKLGEKPGQKYVYSADKRLVSAITSRFPEIKCGAVVTGDSFVSDSSLRELLKKEFSAMSCDMESAAEAYICSEAGVPFCAVRRISDDAGEEATENYRSMNSLADSCLIDIFFDSLENICSEKF